MIPKRDEVSGKRRKLHSEELHNLLLYKNIKHVLGRIKTCTEFWCESLRGDHSEDCGLGVWLGLDC
jgi:hypothetical protein